MTPLLTEVPALVEQRPIVAPGDGAAGTSANAMHAAPGGREGPASFSVFSGAGVWGPAAMTQVERLRDDARTAPPKPSTLNVRARDIDSAPGSLRTDHARDLGAGRSSAKGQAAAALFVFARQEGPLDEAWVRASEVLRSAFRALRQTEPRHADLAQIVSDALRFTPPARIQDLTAAMLPIERAADALLEPFIPTDVELDVQKKLLAAGWRLTRSYGGRWMSAEPA